MSFQEIGTLSAGLVGLSVIGAGGRMAWKAFRRVEAVFDAVEPGEDHLGLKQWQASTDTKFETLDDRLKWVEGELSPNHGSSLRDRIDQIHAQVTQPPKKS